MLFAGLVCYHNPDIDIHIARSNHSLLVQGVTEWLSPDTILLSVSSKLVQQLVGLGETPSKPKRLSYQRTKTGLGWLHACGALDIQPVVPAGSRPLPREQPVGKSKLPDIFWRLKGRWELGVHCIYYCPSPSLPYNHKDGWRKEKCTLKDNLDLDENILTFARILL